MKKIKNEITLFSQKKGLILNHSPQKAEEIPKIEFSRAFLSLRAKKCDLGKKRSFEFETI